MPKVAVKNLEGSSVGEIELSDALFGLEKNNALVHQIYVTLSGNLREPIAHTKTRGDRAGSGMKPWRQKGTGRARVGSRRTPVWKKGGVVFGPRNDRNFSTKANRKMRQKATLIALSDKIREGKFILVDSLQLPERKTKFFAKALSAFGCAGKSTLFAFAGTENENRRAARNLDRSNHTLVANVNVKDILDAQYFIVSKEAVQEMETRFAEWAK